MNFLKKIAEKFNPPSGQSQSKSRRTIPVTDKPRAERAIRSIYKRARLNAPLIIWTESPLANVFAKMAIDLLSDDSNEMAWTYNWRGFNRENDIVRSRAWQSVIDSGWKVGGPETGSPAWDQLQVHRTRERVTWAQIPFGSLPMQGVKPSEWIGDTSLGFCRTVEDAVEQRYNTDWLSNVWVCNRQIKKNNSSSGYRSEDLAMKSGFIEDRAILNCQKNLNFRTVNYHAKRQEFLVHQLPHDFKTLKLSAGWVMPFRHICIVSKHYTQIETDGSGRLKCETGPAISYLDGFSVYADSGVQFPEDWTKFKPTLGDIFYSQNHEQKLAAIEMPMWEWTLQAFKAVIIDKDKDPETGILASIDIPGVGHEKFLCVSCATGREFAMLVPPEMQTAQQAKAWIWDLDSREYSSEIRT